MTCCKVNLTSTGPQIVLCFYSKTNQTHQCIKFILEWNSTCFGRSFCPSSAVQYCTYSNRHMSNRYCCLLASKQTAVSVWQLYVQSWTADDGRRDRPKHVQCLSKINKFDTLVRLIGFTIEMLQSVLAMPNGTCRISLIQINLMHDCTWLFTYVQNLFFTQQGMEPGQFGHYWDWASDCTTDISGFKVCRFKRHLFSLTFRPVGGEGNAFPLPPPPPPPPSSVLCTCTIVNICITKFTQLLHQPLHIYKIYKIYTLKH